MFTGWLTRGIIGLAAAVMAPVALACENPDNITYRLRNEPPERIEPGEVLLELDAGSMRVIEREPVIIKAQGLELAFDDNLASYDVIRVLAGEYREPTAQISMFTTSCAFLGGGDSGSAYLVASFAIDKDGIALLRARPITGAEIRAQYERDEKAAN